VSETQTIGEAAAEARIERNRRGADLVRAALAEATPFRQGRDDSEAIPENLRKAREAAVDYRAGEQRRDNSMKLGRAGGELMTQINQARKQAQQ
jgi:hypothetical protein